MRIREIYFHNVRAFRGAHRISFVDPLTDAVRPVTVIAGTNGTGKTTIFETIEALLRFATSFSVPDLSILAEIKQSGLVRLTFELSSGFLGLCGNTANSDLSEPLHIVFGRSDLVPGNIEEIWPKGFYFLTGDVSRLKIWKNNLFKLTDNKLVEAVDKMRRGAAPLHDGLIYFPQSRQLFPSSPNGGGIQLPPPHRDWISRVTPTNEWQGGLESLWVWQNYLDLEASAQGQTTAHLKSFVETVEDVLGEDRKISVREGRVMVPVAWRQNGDEEPKVRLDQLPSGEQQALLLFGELARRRRLGAVTLVDEPETSLHPTLQRLVVHQLRKFAREWDSQLILATHSLEVLRAVHESQRIILDQLDAAEAQVEEAA
jgi:predicted ATPase